MIGRHFITLRSIADNESYQGSHRQCPVKKPVDDGARCPGHRFYLTYAITAKH